MPPTLRPALLALSVLCLAGAARAQSSYHLDKRVELGGEGGWDYLTVDTARHRIFLSRSTHVMVVDADRDSLIGDIQNTPGVHGVALAPELGRVFTSNGRDSSVSIFDYATLAPISTTRIDGRNPDAILYEPVTRRIFTFNGGSANATAIDAATGRVLGTIPLGGKPEAANHDGHGGVFVNIEDKGEVVSFDAKTLAVRAHWPVAGCEDPTGQGIDRAHRRLFLACGNSVMAVVSYGDGALVTTVPIGAGTDGAAFDPATSLAFSTNGGDGTVTVVHEDSPGRFSVLGSVATQRGARTIALDERTHRVYTVSAEFGTAPAPEPGQRPRRAPIVPGTFMLIVLAP